MFVKYLAPNMRAISSTYSNHRKVLLYNWNSILWGGLLNITRSDIKKSTLLIPSGLKTLSQ